MTAGPIRSSDRPASAPGSRATSARSRAGSRAGSRSPWFMLGRLARSRASRARPWADRYNDPPEGIVGVEVVDHDGTDRGGRP